MSAVTAEDPTVAAPETEAEPTAGAPEDAPTVVREWTRSPEQEAIVREHLEMVEEQYGGADPRLVALLSDTTIIGTPEVGEMLGYVDSARTRLFQLYSKQRRLADVDQVPHPSAIPVADAFGGYRGVREIRGIARGRLVHWMIQSCRFYWDSIRGQLVPQNGINAGGAPKQRRKA